MLGFIIKKLLILGFSLAAASLIIFTLVDLLPGDPAVFMLGINAEPETLAALRVELGLNQSAHWRYINWVQGMMTGDFGISYAYRGAITPIILDRLATSLPLAILALMMAVLSAFSVAIITALNPKSIFSKIILGGAQIGIAIPNFWFAIMLVFVFAITLGVLPAGGFDGWDVGGRISIISVWRGIASLTLPAIALALPQAAILTRVMRRALDDVMTEDFIRTARAKGLSRKHALLNHGLRNAFVPVLTIMGMQFSFLLAGAIIIENVFYLPGLGRLIFQAIAQRDLIMVESVVFLLVVAVMVVSLGVDILYAAIDPRLRRQGRP